MQVLVTDDDDEGGVYCTSDARSYSAASASHVGRRAPSCGQTVVCEQFEQRLECIRDTRRRRGGGGVRTYSLDGTPLPESADAIADADADAPRVAPEPCYDAAYVARLIEPEPASLSSSTAQFRGYNADPFMLLTTAERERHLNHAAVREMCIVLEARRFMPAASEQRLVSLRHWLHDETVRWSDPGFKPSDTRVDYKRRERHAIMHRVRGVPLFVYNFFERHEHRRKDGHVVPCARWLCYFVVGAAEPTNES